MKTNLLQFDKLFRDVTMDQVWPPRMAVSRPSHHDKALIRALNKSRDKFSNIEPWIEVLNIYFESNWRSGR